MDLPLDVGTDDEKFFTSEEEIELPPDVDTDGECFDTGGETSCGCTCRRNCSSCFDAVAIAELRERGEGMSEEENVQRRWDLVRSACTDADGEVKLFTKLSYNVKGKEVPIPCHPQCACQMYPHFGVAAPVVPKVCMEGCQLICWTQGCS